MTTITTKLMMEAAEARGWKAELLDEDYAPIVALTLPDGSVHYTCGTLIESSSAAGLAINRNKLATYRVAQRFGIPVADHIMYDAEKLEAVIDFCEAHWQAGHELVVKPTNCDHGIGITVGVKNRDELDVAVDYAKNFTKKIIIQRRHYGADCRVTIVDGVCVAAARRVPPTVTGDGKHTVSRLIEIENERRQGRLDERQILRLIRPLDAERFLGKEAMAEVPAKGKTVTLSGAANFGRGGTVEDITDQIHPSYKAAGERLARAVGLKVCGVDFLTADHTQPLAEDVAILLEINCAIGLRLHHYPNKGEPRDVAGAILGVIAKDNDQSGPRLQMKENL